MLAFPCVIPYRRTLPALLALAANLIAAGVPVLHVLAHGGHTEPGHGIEVVVDHAGHDHAAVHPDALHDEAAPRSPVSAGFALAVPAASVVLPAAIREGRDAPVAPPRRLSSRAPPPGDPARAPPPA